MNKHRAHSISLFLLLLSPLLYAQPAPDWVRQLDSRGKEDRLADLVTKNGSVYAIGSIEQSIDGRFDYYFVKYLPSGILNYTERNSFYNGGNDDQAFGGAVTSNGKLVVTGRSKQGTDYDIVTLIMDTSSLAPPATPLIWNSSGTQNDYGQVVRTGSSNDIFVGGTYRSTGTPEHSNIVLLKYSSTGTLLYTKHYDGFNTSANDTLRAMVVDASDNVYIAGQSYKDATNGLDWRIAKFNSSLTLVWEVSYNGPGNGSDMPYDILVDNSGNVFVGGDSYSSTTGLDATMIKYNSSGAQQWVDRANGTGSSPDMFRKIVTDNTSTYATGDVYQSTSGGNNILTIKYNSSGTRVWTQTYNGPASSKDAGFGIVVNPSSGDVYVGGIGIDQLLDQQVLVKYNSTGTQQWADLEDGTFGKFTGTWGVGNNNGTQMVGTEYGKIILGGITWTGVVAYDDADNFDWMLTQWDVGGSLVSGAAFSNSVLGEEELPGAPVTLQQNYPNPFNPKTNVQFVLPKASRITLNIYSVTGRLVSTLVENESFDEGNHSVEFDGSGLSSGVYFYEIVANDQVFTSKKMILIK